jgi:PAS domain S-box-containing protein
MTKDSSDYYILVIEDNPGDILLIREYLSEQIESPHITVVNNFSKARNLLETNHQFDIILLDLSLPDKFGTELINEVLEMAKGIPVIILTDFPDMEFSIKSISYGVSDYLIKNDLNASSLYKSILYCLERKKRVHDLSESEKRYSDLFRLNPQPIWIYEPDTLKIIQVNRAAVELYGYTMEEFRTLTLMDIKLEEDIAPLKQILKQHEGSKQTFQKKTKHYTKYGELLDVEVQATVVQMNEKKYRMVIITDVTEKNRMEKEITRAIIKTQENERFEIGAELHDNICQILATTHITLGVLKKSINPAGMELFAQCRDYIKLATQEIRNLSHRLAPAFFNDSTLEEAFSILLKSVNIENKYNTSLFFDPLIADLEIDHDIQLNLYRILQEQLRNIVKYAHCKHIGVELLISKLKLKMRIWDDGVGFEMDNFRGGIGISNMKRRTELFQGDFDIHSNPGEGCEVIIEIPVKTENVIRKKANSGSSVPELK